MLRLVHILAAGVLVATAIALGARPVVAEASEPGGSSSSYRVPGDQSECDAYLAQDASLANNPHGCWIEVELEKTYDGGGLSTWHYVTTRLKVTGVFSIWGVDARSRWKYNGNAVYPVWIDCSDYWAVFPYSIDVTWCGRGLQRTYPYTDWGYNFKIKSGYFTFGHGARQQVWANGNICCESVW